MERRLELGAYKASYWEILYDDYIRKNQKPQPI